MHRSYRPTTSSNNMYLRHKWDKSTFALHRMRVRTAKRAVDNQTPKKYPHIYQKLNPKQIARERQNQIDFENKLLKTRMKRIMEKGGYTGTLDYNTYRKESMIGEFEKKWTLLSIARENARLLNRIYGVDAIYANKKIGKEFMTNRVFFKTLSKFTPPAHSLVIPFNMANTKGRYQGATVKKRTKMVQTSRFEINTDETADETTDEATKDASDEDADETADEAVNEVTDEAAADEAA